MQKIDYLIVGQGIAGTLLTHFLLNTGATVHVLDNRFEDAASKVAAGIINPITGRRFVKSWRVEDLIPFAKATYQELEVILGQRFYFDRTIIRTLFNTREENDWLARSGEVNYQPYMLDEVELGPYATKTHPAYSYGEVKNAAQVDVGGLVDSFAQYLMEMRAFKRKLFEVEHLEQTNGGVRYEGVEYETIIFCEGYRGGQNPYFSYLPFGGTKGEVLIVKIQEGQFEKLLKHRVFIVPLKEKDIYWIGATYDWKFEATSPTDEGFSFLKDRLQELLKVPFEILDHQSAVRPTVKDRRPFLGRHPKFPSLAIFNGLGTKGASLGPFWARHMADHLTKNIKLDPEVDISRFGLKN
ncbi:MAG: FAD-dependent oxidoreductase [Bacteroidota bacterium]